ncbi:MAG: hypothetical protein QW279_12495 [Candidatus Jordarchaeaceae archaeon]
MMKDVQEKLKIKKCYYSTYLIFGASGVRRTFRIEVYEGENIFNGDAIKIKPRRRKEGWYLGVI